LRLKVLSDAQEDLLAGYRFYEQQAPGVGDYFLESLFSDIDTLVLNAGIHPIHFRHYHRLLSRRFPYAVYYRVDGDTVVVFAVLDCRRSPKWISKKLS